MQGLMITATVACLVLTGCSALPDTARGKAALQRGDLQAAERDLLPLADRGYVDAQQALAKAYAKQKDAASTQQAIRYFRKAYAQDPSLRTRLAKALMASTSEQDLSESWDLLKAADQAGDPAALPLMIRFHREHPAALSELDIGALLQRARHRGKPDDLKAIARWLRANAGHGDKHAALIEICTLAQQWLPKCTIDLAGHYRSNGQTEALRNLLQTAMQQHQAGQMPPDVLEQLASQLLKPKRSDSPYQRTAFQLLTAAEPHSAKAQTELALLLMEQTDLDSSRDPLQLLERAARAGDEQAALELGRQLLEGERTLPDPEQAQHWLQVSARTDPRGHYELGEFYQRGYLGQPDPVQALQHYLIAARSGYHRADMALAQMYWDNRGVRRDPARAYVFARLAEHQRLPESTVLLQMAAQSLSQAQFDQAEATAQREFDWRRAFHAAHDPNLSETALLKNVIKLTEVNP